MEKMVTTKLEFTVESELLALGDIIRVIVGVAANVDPMTMLQVSPAAIMKMNGLCGLLLFIATARF